MKAGAASSAAAALALVAGCSDADPGKAPEAATSQAAPGTVAAVVAGSPEHRRLAAALSDTQLAPVLDGKGDYTLLAPGDAAFEALGEKAEALAAPEQRALTIALLRGHILPGQVMPAAIEAAIARRKGPVEMRTMAGGTVRFARDEDGVTVSNGAATARLAPETTAASNGAVLPIDKLLLPAR